jgi:hypothetical protein
MDTIPEERWRTYEEPIRRIMTTWCLQWREMQICLWSILKSIITNACDHIVTSFAMCRVCSHQETLYWLLHPVGSGWWSSSKYWSGYSAALIPWHR